MRCDKCGRYSSGVCSECPCDYKETEYVGNAYPLKVFGALIFFYSAINAGIWSKVIVSILKLYGYVS